MKKCFFLALSLLFAALVSAQMSGTYTIGSSGSNYTSFSAAVSALSAGVSGPVTFQVAPGTYEEYVTINEINGASATNRVIFRGMGADNQQVVITSNAGYTDNATVKLNGTDYVTLENMTVTTTSTGSNAQLLRFNQQCDYNRFENVRFVGVDVSSPSSQDNPKNLVHMYNGDGIVDHDTQFVGCQFINGSIALYLQGKNMTLFNDGLLIEDCHFENQSFKSIYVTFYNNNLVLRGNTIVNANNYKNDYNAIDIFQCYNGGLVENNVINVTRTTSYSTVFRVRPIVGTADNHVIIRNNIIDLQANSNSYAFSIDANDCAYIDFAHNTLKCTGTGENINIFVQKNGTNFNFYNNLLINETNGYVFRFNTNIESRVCDYNRIQCSGETLGRFTTTDYATLADWTTATGFDSHSTMCIPNFVGNNDLHITSADGLTVANPLSYVTTDIDGQNRSTTAPCAGADEFDDGGGTTTVGTASFDDVTLGSNGYWTGEEGENEMFSGGWIFTNYYSQSYSFWGGFTASNHTDMTQTGLNAQYTAATGAGFDGSDQYGVAYVMGYGVPTDVYAADGQEHTVTGFYVTNNLWAYNHILEGETGVTPFGGTTGNDPDWFKLTATGKNAAGQTIGTLDFYLADYRFDNNDEDYVVDTWEWFDLSPLGAVHTISFSLSSTKGNAYGMLTPAYFCIDDFNGTAPGQPQDEPPYVVNPVEDVVFNEYPETIQVNHDGVATDPDNDDDQIVYSIVSNSNQEQLTAAMSGKMLNLTRLTREEATADIVMRATSNGLYVDFNIHVIINYVPDGIDENNDVTISVYPNPAHDYIHVETCHGASVQRVEIYSVTGQKVLTSTETEINVSELPEGVYFVTVFTENQKFVERIIVK